MEAIEWTFGEDLRLHRADAGSPPMDDAQTPESLPEECLETILGLNVDVWLPGWPIRLTSMSLPSRLGGVDITGIDELGCTHLFELKRDVDVEEVSDVVPQGIVYMLNSTSPRPQPDRLDREFLAARIAGFWAGSRVDNSKTEIDSRAFATHADAHAKRIGAVPVPQGLTQRRVHLHIVVPRLSRIITASGYEAAIPYHKRYVPISAWEPELRVISSRREGRLRIQYIPIVAADGDQADESARLLARMAGHETKIRDEAWARFIAYRALNKAWVGNVKSMRLDLGGANVDVLVFGENEGRQAFVHGWYDGKSDALAAVFQSWLGECQQSASDVGLRTDHSASWQTAEVRAPWHKDSEESSARLLAGALVKLTARLAKSQS